VAKFGAERVRMNPSDKEMLVVVARRLAWLTPLIYMLLTVGLWVAHLVAPQAIGPITNYTVEVSLIGAVTFGGLYALAFALRPTRREPTVTD